MAMVITNNYFTVTLVHLSPSLLAFVLFDLLHCCYIAWNCVRKILFTLHIVFLYSYIFNQQIDRMNGSLRKATIQGEVYLLTASPYTSGKVGRRRRREQIVAQAYRRLSYFYRHFFWLISVSTQFNVVISPLAASGLLLHTPLNLLLLANAFLGRQLAALFGRLVVLSVLLIQVALAFLLSSSFITVSQAYHRSDALLYRLQLTLLRLTGSDVVSSVKKPTLRLHQGQKSWRNWEGKGEGEVRAKVKLATFYETICRENVYRHTVGPFAKLSWQALSKFLVAYIGYLLYVAKLVHKNRL